MQTLEDYTTASSDEDSSGPEALQRFVTGLSAAQQVHSLMGSAQPTPRVTKLCLLHIASAASLSAHVCGITERNRN